jgi:hypothetical protein
MAVIVKSAAPKALLAAIKKAIDDKRVDTWSYDDQGDFTQAADQWKTLAWLRPELARESLTFGIIPHRERALTHAILRRLSRTNDRNAVDPLLRQIR